ncbi:MAG: hypothetical protein AC479_00900 [miscellaneous Crenarchaeota group-6 archaeon AD8-1]|nr:MAG: hypothetical protein AC479_00900 [miscellaneous Crenarchaeota group-6 archaeon AD8-1]
MPARKMRVELFDNEGNKYTIAFEGQITRDKAIRLLDLVELLGGMPGETSTNQPINSIDQNNFSRFEKVKIIIQQRFPLIWFSSKEIQSTYEQELKEPISLSTVSTYLARMTKRGILLRSGNSNNLKYKIALLKTQPIIESGIKYQ